MTNEPETIGQVIDDAMGPGPESFIENMGLIIEALGVDSSVNPSLDGPLETLKIGIGRAGYLLNIATLLSDIQRENNEVSHE